MEIVVSLIVLAAYFAFVAHLAARRVFGILIRGEGVR
jgi:hypothetical protein